MKQINMSNLSKTNFQIMRTVISALFMCIILSAFSISGGKKVIAHKIADGENIYRISLKYRTSIQEILNLNPGLKENKIQTGQTIKVPVDADFTMSAPIQQEEEVVSISSANMNAMPAEINTTTKYRVMENETWEDVAGRFRMKVSGLLDMNSNIKSDLSEGMVINVPTTISSKSIAKMMKMTEKISRENIQFISYNNDVVTFKSVQDRRQEIEQLAVENPNITLIDNSKIHLDETVQSGTEQNTSLSKIYEQISKNRAVIVNLQIMMKDGSIQNVKNPSEQIQVLNKLMNEE